MVCDSLEVLFGSPPRVRSRHDAEHSGWHGVGITSACAEQTRRCAMRQPTMWDHLRVCGADTVGGSPRQLKRGSPPRVRSRPDVRPP